MGIHNDDTRYAIQPVRRRPSFVSSFVLKFLPLLLLLSFLLQGCSSDESTEDPAAKPQWDNPEIPVADKDLVTSFGQYHAIIIGIDQYHHWPALRQAEDDAQELQRILNQHYGFAPENMTLLYGENATRTNVLFAVEQKFRHLTSKDNLLVFFAGHGQLDDLNGSGFWIPVDGDLADRSSWIRFSTISDYLHSEQVEINDLAIITDSCYGGALLKLAQRAVSVVPVSKDDYALYYSTLQQNAGARSRRILASGGPDETVSDDSMFARVFMEALENNTRKFIDLDLLFNLKVFPEMAIKTTQAAKLLEVDSRVGDNGHFVFVRQDYSANDDAAVIATEVIDETLPRAGVATLTVRSNLVGDTVILDGVDKGSTRLDVSVIPGQHHVLIKKAGYHPFERNIEISLGEHETIVAKLEPIEIPTPTIEFFSAEVNTIRPGESAELVWQTKHATDVTIAGVGSIARAGNVIVNPSTTTNYTLIAKNSAGASEQRSLTVNVVSNAPVISHFEAKPREIRAGDKVYIAWKTEDAASVTLSGRPMSNSGDVIVNPRKSQTLTLTAVNSDGQKVDANVNITVIGAPKVTKFQAARASIAKGNTTRLHWQTEGADYVVIDGLGKFRPQGHVDIKPEQTTTYELIAYGGKQKQVSSVKVAVTTGWKEVDTLSRIPNAPNELVVNDPVQLTVKDTAAAGAFVGAVAGARIGVETVASVIISNSLTIKQTWTVDLDTGKSGAGTASDVWYNAKTATDRYLTTRNGSLMGPLNSGSVSAAQCKRQAMKSRSLPISKLVAGSSVCIKTNKGNTSLLQIVRASGPSPGKLVTKFTTWR